MIKRQVCNTASRFEERMVALLTFSNLRKVSIVMSDENDIERGLRDTKLKGHTHLLRRKQIRVLI